MDSQTVNNLLSLKIFKPFSQEHIKQLLASCQPQEFKKDSIVFEEDSSGQSLFVVLKGEISIEKKLDPSGKEFKTLAVMGEGDFFGEMSLLESEVRFARARATAGAVLLELKKDAVMKLLELSPVSTTGFFMEIIRVTASRLRKTSTELTMIYDLSRLIFASYASEKDFLYKLLGETMLHLEGRWAARAYMFNQFNEEVEFAAATGKEFAVDTALFSPDAQSKWLDNSSYLVVLPGVKRTDGYIVFRCDFALSAQDRNSLAVSFSTIGYIANAVTDNIRNAKENELRDRLSTSRYNPL